MNISIIGPEQSGKTTLAKQIAKKVAFGRPIYMITDLKNEFTDLQLDNFGVPSHCVVIVDDANAILDSTEVYTKDKRFKNKVIKARNYGRVNIYVFHSFDDAVKLFFRQSRYIYVSKRYRDESHKNNKFIKGVQPVEVGRGKYLFDRYKRY